jgi:hypothetical protein
MPNPSTTQVVESREQIALADDAGGVNRDRMWALELCWDEVEKSVGEISVGGKPDFICEAEPAHRGLECQFTVLQLPDTVQDGLFGMPDHRRRGRCPFPSELTGSCRLDVHLPLSGSSSRSQTSREYEVSATN